VSQFTPFALALAAVLSGCGSTRQESARGNDAASVATPSGPADSLALSGPDQITVWFTAAREARSAGGETCAERALEIRQDTLRRGVPLLYTREAPTLLGKDAIRAVLYNNCVPTAAYRVDFATVSPKRLEK
jgi:hypothetical protein